MSPRPLPPDRNDEPLTADERGWAARLAQIGPHGDPPPALDARILALAHASAARQPQRRAARRRWPTLVGAAASLVIVVGLAWQLQPLLRTRPSFGEGPGAPATIPRSDGTLSADVLAAAKPVAKRAVASPPPAPAAETAAVANRRSPPPAPAAVRAQDAPPPRAAAFGDDAVPPYSDYAGKAAARQTATEATARDGSQGAMSEPRRERAAAMAPQAFPPASAPAGSRAAVPAPTPAPPAPAVAAPENEAQAGGTPPTLQTNAAAKQDNATLDQVDVTGTRMRVVDLPVRDDAGLDPASWLQRIRDRRDAGDLEQARASLVLFRREHPRLSVPDDLARLGN